METLTTRQAERVAGASPGSVAVLQQRHGIAFAAEDRQAGQWRAFTIADVIRLAVFRRLTHLGLPPTAAARVVAEQRPMIEAIATAVAGHPPRLEARVALLVTRPLGDCDAAVAVVDLSALAARVQQHLQSMQGETQ